MRDISLSLAEDAIDSALAQARRLRMRPLGVAVIDAGGNLVAFRREDGATELRYSLATAKAWTALNLGMPSRGFETIAQERPHFAASLSGISGGRMTPAAGGLLLCFAGDVVGAIGVSGDSPDNDEVAATAGAAALDRHGADRVPAKA